MAQIQQLIQDGRRTGRGGPPRLVLIPLSLILMVLCLVAWAIPPVRATLLRWDVAIAWNFNEILGHNRVFDNFIAAFCTDLGSFFVGLLLGVIFLGHVLHAGNVKRGLRRFAFWTFVAISFAGLYKIQSTVEGALDRHSPARVLAGWYDLRQETDFRTNTRKRFSFPSGHASAFFFLAFMAFRRYRGWAAWAILGVGMFSSLARVATGAHWLSDIMIGSMLFTLLAVGIATETPLRHLESLIGGIYKATWRETVQKRRFAPRECFLVPTQRWYRGLRGAQVTAN